MNFLILFFPVLLFLVPFFLIRRLFASPRCKKILPPSPGKLPIIGNLHQLGPFQHRSLRSLAQRHGPVMMVHLGRIPTLVVSSADGAHEIMKTHDHIFSDRPQTSRGKRLLYNSRDMSSAPYGEYWRQIKSLCILQLLSNKRVQSFSKVRIEETALMVKKIGECSALHIPVNLSDLFESVTNDVISRAAFGRKYGEGKRGKEIKQLFRELLQLLSGPDIGDLFPGCWWVSRVNGSNAEVERVAKGLDEFLEDVVEDRMNGFRTKSACGGKVESNRPEDFLDILLSASRNNTSIDKDCVKALVLDAL